jgi:hypothetical protein
MTLVKHSEWIIANPDVIVSLLTSGPLLDPDSTTMAFRLQGQSANYLAFS